MAGFAVSGMASGLPPNLVDQLMDAERIPVKQMEAKKGKTENRLKLVNELETKVVALRDSLLNLASGKGFSDIAVTTGDAAIVSGTADPNLAQTGNWNLEVMSLPQKASAMTNGFPDKDKTQIGSGYFRFKTAEGDKDVYIEGEHSTLAEVVGKINGAEVGVKASIAKDNKDPDNPFKLILSGDKSGSQDRVEYPTLYFLDGDQDIFFEGKNDAKNGKIKVDGFEIEVTDSKLQDLIPGVTLDLKQAAPGKSIAIGVAENREAVSGKIKNFVDSANGILGFIQSQNKTDQTTDTSQTLSHDNILRSVESKLRSLIQNPQPGLTGPITRLAQLGVEFNRNGTLEFKQEKFNKVLAENPNAVKNFFVGDGAKIGMIPSVRREVGAMLDGGFGVISNKKAGIKSQIEQMDRRIGDKEKSLVKKEEQLRNKFARLEETVSKLKAQGQSLAQHLGPQG